MQSRHPTHFSNINTPLDSVFVMVNNMTLSILACKATRQFADSYSCARSMFVPHAIHVLHPFNSQHTQSQLQDTQPRDLHKHNIY